MLKVFLVEDEFVMREGIKNNVDWKSHGYEFCGEASDGELALPMIQKCRPDIVITDIRMPFMDGLTLSKLIKKELPWTEIIILTGYEEFEYAKEGIKIGVAQYLSKPISGEELLREMDALAVKIVEKQKERSIREKYMQEIEENFRMEKKKLFRFLVTGDKSAAELLEMADKLGIDLSSLWYNIVLLKTQSIDHADNEYSNRLVKIEQELRNLDDETNLLNFDRSLEGKALLFRADSREELLRVQEHYLNRMREILAGDEKIRYFGGVGMPVNRLCELPVSFEKASRAFAHRYLVRDSLILRSDEMEQVSYLDEKEFSMQSVNLRRLDRGKIQEFLKLGQKEEAIYFVEEFFNDLGTNAMRSAMFRQYIVMDTYFCVCDFLEGLQIDRAQIKPFDTVSGVLQNREKAMQYTVEIIGRAIELREKTASGHNRDIVGEVIRYIENHYGDEELSLNMLASHVNFSPNYLSMIFSQQTGQPFIKYLTDYRMGRAKELLRCTGKKSSEISVEVGYKDSHYFSYLFKKTQGMTPTQYRGRNSAEGGGRRQMRDKLRQLYDHSSLAAKIRCSYLVLLIPIVMFIIFCFYNLWDNNRQYEDMVNSTAVASEFSLDFKKDFDYEAYLLIVENTSIEQSKLRDMLGEAKRVVIRLEELTPSGEKSTRLESIRKYLNNLETYVDRIEQNLREGNKYEDNIEIWENDIQIVTTLVQETVSQYIYYEVRGIQRSREEYQNFFMEMIRFSVIAFACILILILFLSYSIPLSITRPITELSKVTDHVAKGNLTVRSNVKNGAEVRVLSDSMNAMIDKINELLEQVKEEQIRLRKAEFERLQSQINPHFLYNTLDAIIWLAEAGEQKKVVSMVGSLSEFFRTSLNRGRDIVSIREEVQHVRSYLEIQYVRYQDILQYEIHVPHELEKYLIPKITIQPLVENALYHGIKNKRGRGSIVLSGKVEEGCVVLRIEDNGIGIDGTRLRQVREGIQNKVLTGKDMYGLYNVHERIRLNFGEKYGISIDSVYGEGTSVCVILPKTAEEDGANEKNEPES